MSTYVLKAARRDVGRAGALRRGGFVPGIVYGGGGENVAVKMAAADVLRFFQQQGGRGILQLEIDGRPETVMVKEVQRHPVRLDVLHIDFQRVRMTEKVHASVPLRLEGEEALVKTGAVLQHALREVEVSCLPADLPSELVVDVSSLAPGASLTVGDLQAPPGVEILNDPDQVVAVAVAGRAARTAGQAAPEAGQEAGAGAAEDAGQDAGDDAGGGDA